LALLWMAELIKQGLPNPVILDYNVMK
jgi:hypothetical protein